MDQELESADLVVAADYRFHATTHAPLEPHCAVAQMWTDGLSRSSRGMASAR